MTSCSVFTLENTNNDEINIATWGFKWEDDDDGWLAKICSAVTEEQLAHYVTEQYQNKTLCSITPSYKVCLRPSFNNNTRFEASVIFDNEKLPTVLMLLPSSSIQTQMKLVYELMYDEEVGEMCEYPKGEWEGNIGKVEMSLIAPSQTHPGWFVQICRKPSGSDKGCLKLAIDDNFTDIGIFWQIRADKATLAQWKSFLNMETTKIEIPGPQDDECLIIIDIGDLLEGPTKIKLERDEIVISETTFPGQPSDFLVLLEHYINIAEKKEWPFATEE